MKHLRRSIRDEPNASLREILDRLCRVVLDDELATAGLSDECLGHIAVSAVFLDDESLFYRAQEKARKHWKDGRWLELGEHIDLRVSSIDKEEYELPP